MLKSIKNFVFMSILALTYLLLRFVHLLSFLRSLFICPCGSHRHLFVICSFIVRLLFVFCSFIVRLLFVFCSSLRRCSSPFGGSQRKLGMCKGEVLFVFPLSACRATTARVAHTCPCGSHRLSYKLSISTLFYSSVPIC